jgi:preprotein translocase subunit SecE
LVRAAKKEAKRLKIVSNIINFVVEVKAELTKVAWSTRQELLASTVLVLTITGIMAVFIGLVDIALSKSLTLLFKA